MTTFLVFNDICLRRVVESVAVAKGCLEEFSEVLVDRRIKGRKILVVPELFLQLQVAAGYSIGRWIANSKWADPEKRVRIKTLIDRSSRYSECIPTEEIDGQDVEYRCSGEIAKGLFVAHSIEGLALSLKSSEQWDVPSVNVEKSWIQGDEIESRVFHVPHCCRIAHVEANLEWLDHRRDASPLSGAELWQERSSVFPDLDFCESVEAQVATLGANDPSLRAIIRGLFDLQRYCEVWESGGFDIHLLANASGESQPTLNMYSEERTFRCPDGQYRLFEWHIKKGATRIHFVDFPEQKRLLVGYAGKHLRISSQ